MKRVVLGITSSQNGSEIKYIIEVIKMIKMEGQVKQCRETKDTVKVSKK